MKIEKNFIEKIRITADFSARKEIEEYLKNGGYFMTRGGPTRDEYIVEAERPFTTNIQEVT